MQQLGGDVEIIIPPYTITEKATNLLAKIGEVLSRLEYNTGFRRDIQLHRVNRIQSIHSSLAIEGNALSLSEVKDVLSGKLVFGRQADIQEVKNAYNVYDKMMDFDPYNINDFLKGHEMMTKGLIDESGKFRRGNVGVFANGKPIHMGARPQFVHSLVADLFAWAAQSELHPVLKSSVVHFEIETIHPFSDGNGRMGRLWHTLILAKWRPIFAWIPLETAINEKRQKYYDAIASARDANDSGVFIEYCLSAVYDTISLLLSQQMLHQERLNEIQHAILNALAGKSLSRKEIFTIIGKSGDSRSFKRYLEPLLVQGLIEMTVPDKPSSRGQRYRLTNTGRREIKG